MKFLYQQWQLAMNLYQQWQLAIVPRMNVIESNTDFINDPNKFSEFEIAMLMYYKELADKFDKLIENYWYHVDTNFGFSNPISLHDFHNLK